LRDKEAIEKKIQEERSVRRGGGRVPSETALRELKESIAEGDFIASLFGDHPYLEQDEDSYLQAYRFLQDRVRPQRQATIAPRTNPKAKERNYRITVNRVLARAYESGKLQTPSALSLVFSFDQIPDKLNLKRYYALSTKPVLNGKIVPFTYSMLQSALISMVLTRILADALMPIVDLVRMKEIFATGPMVKNRSAVSMFSLDDMETDRYDRDGFATLIASRLEINLGVHVVSKAKGGQMSFVSSKLYKMNQNSNTRVDVLFFEYQDSGPIKTMIQQCEPLKFLQ